MNILLVDDEAIQLETLERGLRNRGHEVKTATGGREALRCLASASPAIDLVITDFAMPEMNGVELLKAVRQKFKSVPVILMTGQRRKEIAIEALQNDCSSFLEKPFTLSRLMFEIRSIMEKIAK